MEAPRRCRVSERKTYFLKCVKEYSRRHISQMPLSSWVSTWHQIIYLLLFTVDIFLQQTDTIGMYFAATGGSSYIVPIKSLQATQRSYFSDAATISSGPARCPYRGSQPVPRGPTCTARSARVDPSREGAQNQERWFGANRWERLHQGTQVSAWHDL